MDLSIAGPWAGFAQPLVLGSAKIKAVVPVNGIGTPVQVTSAAIDLAPDGIFVQHVEFGWPKAAVMLAGSMRLPRRCTTIETCPVDFKLHADTLDVAALNALLNPDKQKRPWYAFIETSAAIIVLAPILAPVAQHFGIDPVHFGLVMVVNLALGMITPPFGVNLFAACTVARISLDRIVKQLIPFVLVVLACLLIITYVPSLSLTLRDFVYAK